MQQTKKHNKPPRTVTYTAENLYILKLASPDFVKTESAEGLQLLCEHSCLPGIADDVGHKEENILRLGELPKGLLHIIGRHFFRFVSLTALLKTETDLLCTVCTYTAGQDIQSE